MSYQKHNWVTREIIRRQYLQNIEDGIYNEQERAIAAEVELGAALTTETSRAVAKENQINSAVTDLSNSLTSETSRATTKESALESALETAIGNEITRATTAEGQLSSSMSLLGQTVNDEISRATQAESNLHDYVDQKVTGLYKPSGSVYFADLPGLAASRVGNVYDVIDAFTTTSDFREGAGKSYGPGTNVVIIDNGGSLKYDVLPGFVDTSSFYSTGDTNEATIAAGDYFPFYDVSASAKKKTLFSNLRSKLNIPGIATNSTAGIVKPDGTSITIDNDGTIHGGAGSAEAAERMIAPIEADDTASTRAYTVGQKLIVNEVLYKAKTAIAIGDALVVDTNIEEANSVTTDLDSKVSKSDLYNLIYPVGSVYISTTNTNPSATFGGTWELMGDGYLRNNALATSGGSLTSGSTTLTANQIPSHSHTATTQNTGAHTHTATTGSYGEHTHTATTGSYGAHTHTATTGSYGAHTHTLTTNNPGNHSHTATTGSYGAHKHNLNYYNYQNPGSGTAYIPYNITNKTLVGQDSAAFWKDEGAHTHTLTTNSNGGHTHTATTGSYGAHTHTLTTGSYGAHTHTLTTGSYGAHTHTLTTGSYGNHTHTLTTSSVGGGQGHTHSIEPTYIGIYAFKRTA